MIEDIKSKLRELDSEQLTEIKSHCEYLLSRTNPGKNSSRPAASKFSQDFYEIIQLAAKREGIQTFPSLDILERKQDKTYKNYLAQVNALEGWITDTFEGLCGKNMAFIRRLLVSIFMKKMREQYEEKLGYYIILNNLHRIPSLFEDQFPGYIESNMQCVVLNLNKNK